MPRDSSLKLEPARTDRSLEGERRIVTILFCDVSGSTSMAEKLDPEEWTGIMNRAFSQFLEPIYRYEGTIARLMGDAILAFFGAPIAHEDDPRRALLASLEILAKNREFREEVRQNYGLDFNVRIGINTGLVVVGTVGSDLMMEYTAMGDAVNLAARMEQTAEPGTIQLTEHTYRLVSRQFDFKPLGEIIVKGKSDPITTYQVLQVIPGSANQRGIDGLQSPLVGRDQELSKLRQAIDRLREGKGGILSIIGDAGLGKSRLILEARAESGVRWLEGRSLSYEISRPHAPFVDLLNKTFDLKENQPAAEKLFRIKTRLEDLDPAGSSDLLPYLALLMGLQPVGEDYEKVRYLEPPHLRERTISAVRRLFERLAVQQPTAVVIDDLHWADRSSLNLIEELLPLVDHFGLLFVILFRPQRQDPSWEFHERIARTFPQQYVSIALQPLDVDQAKQLVSNLLYIEDLPQKVRSLILQQAEGNPFFVEEMIRSLLDTGLVIREGSRWIAVRDIEKITVPETLTGVITARLDRLEEESRRVVQTAAVIGREFSIETLAAIHGSPDQLLPILTILKSREFIQEKILDHREMYAFRHVLIQETAYNSLLNSKRREIHRRVAEYLEKMLPDRPEEIARHFLEGKEGPRAFPYLLQAADRAARAYSTQEAAGYYRQALQLIPETHDDDLARKAYEGMGSVLAFSNQIQPAIETYQTMVQYGQEHDNVAIQVSALNKMSDLVAMRLGQFPQAEKLLADAEQLARTFGDRGGLAELYMVRCGLCTASGDFDGAIHYLSESVHIGEELAQKEQMAFGLAHIANTQVFMTRFDEAWNTARVGSELARQIGNRERLAELMTFAIPMVHWRNGEWVQACQVLEEGISMAEQIGATYPDAMGSFVLGSFSLSLGEYEKAIAWLEHALRAGEESGYAFLQAMPLCTLGTIYQEISDQLDDRAREYQQKTLHLLDLPGGQMGGGMCWADLGWSAFHRGDPEKARQYFELGLHVPTPSMLLQKPVFLLGLASVEVAQAQLDRALGYWQQAQQYIDEKGMVNFSPLAGIVSASLAAAGGDHSKALDEYVRARARAEGMGMLPLALKAAAGAAQVLNILGRRSEAQAEHAAAETLARQMAAAFADEPLKRLFMERRQAQLNAIG